jgi:hypothetical protein
MKQATKTKVITGGMPAEAGLRPHTRVQLKYDAKQKGTVMPYMRECSQGLLGFFPIRLDNAIWWICKASDVILLEPKDAS